jgi:hypothetical protein
MTQLRKRITNNLNFNDMRLTKKVKEQIKLENRVAELRAIQRYEVENNFPNGFLWDECHNKIENLKMYGQEEQPVYVEPDNDEDYYRRSQY